MTPERRRRVMEVFESALVHEGEERAAFIERASEGDQGLRDAVWSLIFHDGEAGSFIEAPAAYSTSPLSAEGTPGLAAGRIVGPYRIVRQLGAGAMGVVYLAHHTKLDRPVALKLLPEQFMKDKDRVRRFEQEARAASKLDHKNIITIHDIVQADGLHYIVTEYVDGETLRERVGALPANISEVLDLVGQVASALGAAHEAGIVHRDIKPENIMVRGDGTVKVLDWGLAKLIEARAADSDAATMFQTRPGVVAGTPNYMSPEQVAGAPAVAQSDLFSLGAVLYECLTGELAFPGRGVWEIWEQIRRANPPPPSRRNPGVPPELDRITFKLLAKKPGERYQSADELLGDLRAACDKILRRERKSTQGHPGKVITSLVLVLKTLQGKLRGRRRLLPLALLLLAAAPLTFWVLTRTRPGTEAKIPVWYEEGTRALRNGSYLQARINLERAVNEDGQFALAHVRLAEAYLELDSREKARDELDQFHNLIPNRSKLPQADRLYVEGVMALARRDYAGAVRSYAAIVKLTPDEPQAYVDLGRAYEKNNDAGNAVANYQEAVSRDPYYATAFLRLGILHGRQQRQQESDDAFAKAEQSYRARGNVEGRAEVHYQHGVVLMSKQNVRQAREELQRALDLARAAGNEALEILSKLQLGYAYMAEGNPARAQELAEDAVGLAKRSGMQAITMRGLIDLGNASYSMGNLADAGKYYQEALGYAVSSNDARNEARARFMLGSLQIARGDTESGLGEVEKAFQYYAQGGYKEEAAKAQLLIGRAERDRGRYEEALKVFTDRLGAAQQAGVPVQIAEARDEVGKVLLINEKYPESLPHFEASYEIYMELNDSMGVGYSLLNRGDALWRVGRYREAESLLGQASELASKSGGYRGLLAEVDKASAEMLLSQGRSALARSKAEKFRSEADSDDATALLEAQLLLCQIETRSGKGPEAVRLCAGASESAAKTAKPWLISRAQLSYAEALLDGGREREALERALRAQGSFAAAGQPDSEWRALLFAALASRKMGDRLKAAEYAARAKATLSGLEGERYKADFAGYASRWDVRSLRKRLDLLSTAG